MRNDSGVRVAATRRPGSLPAIVSGGSWLYVLSWAGCAGSGSTLRVSAPCTGGRAAAAGIGRVRADTAEEPGTHQMIGQERYLVISSSTHTFFLPAGRCFQGARCIPPMGAPSRCSGRASSVGRGRGSVQRSGWPGLLEGRVGVDCRSMAMASGERERGIDGPGPGARIIPGCDTRNNGVHRARWVPGHSSATRAGQLGMPNSFDPVLGTLREHR